MKAIIGFLFILGYLNTTLGGVEIRFTQEKVTQGSLQKVELALDEESFSKLDSFNLQGSKINDVIYIQEVTPFTRKGADSYETNATIIFLKVPETPNGTIETPKGKLNVSWRSIEVVSTDVSENFLFGEFEIPKSPKLVLWLAIMFGVIAGIFGLTKVIKNIKKRNKSKKYISQLKLQIESAQTYENIVDIWKKKHEILKFLPEIQSSFATLEKELFLYQFKPTQSESEKESVKRAYFRFLEEIKGALNGV